MRPFDQVSILMVDDDPAVRESMSWLLEEEGFRVHVAGDGEAALRKLDEVGHVDLVLSDINMPVMDGIELSRRLSNTQPGLPMLLMSGRPHSGLDRVFLPKPFRLDALRVAIRSVLPHDGSRL